MKNNELKILDIIYKLCTHENTWIEVDDTFYIDGCVHISKEEQDLIKQWLTKDPNISVVIHHK